MRLMQKKKRKERERKKKQITNMRNRRGAITTDFSESAKG